MSDQFYQNQQEAAAPVSFNEPAAGGASMSMPPPPPVAFVNCDVDKSKQVQMPLMVAPGNHARAWNDPPMLATTGASKPSGVTKLNKRVAFPLTSSPGLAGPAVLPMQVGPPGSAVPMQPGLPGQYPSMNPMNLPAQQTGLPPLTQPSPSAPGPGSYVLPSSQFVPTTNVSFNPYQPSSGTNAPAGTGTGGFTQGYPPVINNEIPQYQQQESNQSKEQVIRTLRQSVDDSGLEMSQKEEVHKRLDVLDQNWPYFENDLKRQLEQLSNHIGSKDYKEADKIQMLIGQDYMSQHSSWILALRNVIRMLLTMQQQQQGQQEQLVH